ncbi:anaerobic ribonucleoside-triphosphate reductase activating protein [Staphylococcus canis]|uniref:Anaerobic ribonucleoside-triphosphate reductase-activating protein n=1 Tax=Staphylococcus canis TaxID=2724942 RepID=A0ABS0TDE9_9STAP|nr:anaerobic ribonucleoside-triphosphate reductase activating protein [Staphylococcus canis]MBI5975996.1 anaerobic ribonucleoside-triphosphate reductase activating protein [Staphylococcus canis]
MGYIAKIEYHSFVDGEGVRCSVYVSGCPFKCEGCYNVAAQHFRYGEPLTDDIIEEILEACAPSYISGLSLLGGEPFCNLNVITPLIHAFRERFGQTKTIWMWTGFQIEYLSRSTRARQAILSEIDVLVDGMFIAHLYQPNLPYKGSLNQRVIDVPTYLKTQSIAQAIYIQD